MAAIGISINCAGIFFAAVSEELGVGRGDVSLTVTLTNVVTGLMGPLVASRLFGRVNIKNFNRDWLRVTALCFAGMSAAKHIAVFLCAQYADGHRDHRLQQCGDYIHHRQLVSGEKRLCNGHHDELLRPWRRDLQSGSERGDRGVRLARGLSHGGRLCSSADAAGRAFVIRERPEDKGLLPYGAAESMPGCGGQADSKRARLLSAARRFS